MADERLQRLRRASAQAGDPVSQARVLIERVRCGEVARESLRLAALLGDPAAVQAAGVEPDPRACDKALAALVAGSPAHFVRVALGFARVTRPLIARFAPGFGTLSDEVVAGTDEWLSAGTQQRRDRASRRVADLRDDVISVHGDWIVGGSRQHRSVMLSITGVFEALACRVVPVFDQHRSGRSRVINSMRSELGTIEDALEPGTWSSEAALRDELVPWVLGLPDDGSSAPTKTRRNTSVTAEPAAKRRAKPAGVARVTCICGGCGGCKRRTRCPTLVRSSGRDRCSKCWRVAEEARVLVESLSKHHLAW